MGSTQARPPGPPRGPGLLLQEQESRGGLWGGPSGSRSGGNRGLRQGSRECRDSPRDGAPRNTPSLSGGQAKSWEEPWVPAVALPGKGASYLSSVRFCNCVWLATATVAFQWDPGARLPLLPGSCPGGCVMQPASKHPTLPLALSGPGPSRSSPTAAATLPGSRVQHRWQWAVFREHVQIMAPPPCVALGRRLPLSEGQWCGCALVEFL